MKTAVYISLLLFLMLFIYNSFGDNTIPAWNVFYWGVLAVTLVSLNLALRQACVVPAHRMIFGISAAYWAIFCIAEIVTLFTGEYTRLIAEVNLWTSRSLIIFAGLIFLHVKSHTQ